jgi:aerobic carbon-monoxide dehydrogenase small subunit
MQVPVKIRVNGALRESEVEPRLLLVQFLRDVCGLTGTHIGCETVSVVLVPSLLMVKQ